MKKQDKNAVKNADENIYENIYENAGIDENTDIYEIPDNIADKQKCGAKTLFATHYHELTELENKIEGIKNYSIAVK